MTQQIFVQAVSSEIWHIAPQKVEETEYHRTLCGRHIVHAMRNPFMGIGSQPHLPAKENRCPTCEKRGDFDALYREWHEIWEQEERKRKERRAREAARNTRRHELREGFMPVVAECLGQLGEVTKVKNLPAGGTVEFEVVLEGEIFQFHLRVNDYDGRHKSG